MLNGCNDLSASKSKFHIMAVRDCVVTSNMKLVSKSTVFVSRCPGQKKKEYNEAFLFLEK